MSLRLADMNPEQLVQAFEDVIVEWTKVTNFSSKPVPKNIASRESKIRAELVRRMEL